MRANIAIMRAFVRLRRMLASNAEFRRKVAAMERRLEKHDTQIEGIFDAIRNLMAAPPAKSKRQIGFRAVKKG